LVSIVVHGLSIPILSIIYGYYSVDTIAEDAVEIRRRSIYVPTPPNAFKGDHNTFIAYNRFFRPLANLSMLPLAHTRSREYQGGSTMADAEDTKDMVTLGPVKW
jgi:hypothetical protein